jgi:glycine/D-amino acid oxidase-like deaminating enzyme
VWRDLHSGTPVWLAGGEPRSPFARIQEDLRADVVVVGAGVSGALIADAILRTGRTVAVVDRRGPGLGSSRASTALLEFELDTPLTHLSKKIGKRDASRAYWRSASAVAYLKERITDLGLRCGLRDRVSLYLPGNLLGVRGLRHECDERAAIGLRSTFLDAPALFEHSGLRADAAILSAGAAEVDPLKLVMGLWRRAKLRGALLASSADVVGVDDQRGGIVLEIAGGFAVRARHAVFATGYEPLSRVPKTGHRIVSTWAMATKRQPRKLWSSRALIWEAAEPYHYLRTTVDGRIIIGGEDEPFSDAEARDALTEVKVERLRRALARLVPNADTRPAYAWAGCFGTTQTGLPSIGRVPGMKGCFAVLGYGGNGFTFSAIAAQIISREIAGLADPDADLFAF